MKKIASENLYSKRSIIFDGTGNISWETNGF